MFKHCFSIVTIVVLFCACSEDNPVGPQNQKPTISSITCVPETLFTGETATITVIASDPDGDPIGYSFTATGGSVSGTGNTAVFKAGYNPGNATVTVTVSDDRGANAAKSATLVIEQLTSTRLYLRRDSLSILPNTGTSSTQAFIYSSSNWTATIAGDMVGTECTFGILMAVPPNNSMVAKVEVIIKRGIVETVIAAKTWTVSSSTYERFLHTESCNDPQGAAGDQLIVRITKVSNGSQGLGVLIDTAAPNDSYVDVPFVELL